MQFNKRSRSNPQKSEIKASLNSHIRDSAAKEEQHQWEKKMREKKDFSSNNSDFEKRTVDTVKDNYNAQHEEKTPYNSSNGAPYIPSPEKTTSDIKKAEYDNREREIKRSSIYAATKQKNILEQTEVESQKLSDSETLNFLLNESNNEPGGSSENNFSDIFKYNSEINPITPETDDISEFPEKKEENISLPFNLRKDESSNKEDTDVKLYEDEHNERYLDDLNKSISDDRNNDTANRYNQSHLRDSSLEIAQDNWKYEEKEGEKKSYDTSNQSYDNASSNITDKLRKIDYGNSSFEKDTPYSSQKDFSYIKEVPSTLNQKQSHLRDSTILSQQNQWDINMQTRSNSPFDSHLLEDNTSLYNSSHSRIDAAQNESEVDKFEMNYKKTNEFSTKEYKTATQAENSISSRQESYPEKKGYREHKSHLRDSEAALQQKQWDKDMQVTPDYTSAKQSADITAFYDSIQPYSDDTIQSKINVKLNNTEINKSSTRKEFSKERENLYSNKNTTQSLREERLDKDLCKEHKSHLRDSAVQAQQTRWNQELNQKNNHSSYTTEETYKAGNTDEIKYNFQDSSSSKKKNTGSKENIMPLPYVDAKQQKNLRQKTRSFEETAKDTEFDSTSSDIRSDLLLKRSRIDKETASLQGVIRDDLKDSYKKTVETDKKSHLRDSKLHSEQTQWENMMQEKKTIFSDDIKEQIKIDSLPQKTSDITLQEKKQEASDSMAQSKLTPRIEKTFSVKESDSLKDVSSIPKNRGERSFEKYNESNRTWKESHDKVVETNKKSHLRDSKLKAEQLQWEDRMQQKSDSISETSTAFDKKESFNFKDKREFNSNTENNKIKQELHNDKSEFNSDMSANNKKSSLEQDISSKEESKSKFVDFNNPSISKETKKKNKKLPESHLRDSAVKAQEEYFKEEIERKTVGDRKSSVPKDFEIESSEKLLKDDTSEIPLEKRPYRKDSTSSEIKAEKIQAENQSSSTHLKKVAKGVRDTEQKQPFSSDTINTKDVSIIKNIRDHDQIHLDSDYVKEKIGSQKLDESKNGVKEEQLSKSHLRDSVVKTQQEYFKEKMREKDGITSSKIFSSVSDEKKELSVKKTDAVAEKENKEISPAIPEPDKNDTDKKSKKFSKETDKKEKALDKVKREDGPVSKGKKEEAVKKEDESVEELIKKRDQIQKKAKNHIDVYTLQKYKRFMTNGMTKILAKQKQILKSGKDFVWRNSSAQTDTGRGIKETSDNVAPFVHMAIDTAKRSLGASIAGGIASDKKFQEAFESFRNAFNLTDKEKKRLYLHVDPTKAMTREDFRILQKDIRKILRDHHIGDFSSNPIIMKLQLARAVKALKLTPEEAKAILTLSKRIAEVGSLSGRSNIYHLMGFARRKLHKYGRQESTINAVFMTKAFLQHSKNIVKNAITTTKLAYSAARTAAKKASLAAAKASVKISKTKLAKKVSEKLPDGVKKARAKSKQKKQKRRQKKKKRQQKRRQIRDAIDIIIDKVPRPVKAAKQKIGHAKAEVFSFLTRGKYNPLRYIAKIFSVTQQVKTMIVCGILGLTLIYFVLVAFILIITALCGQYAMDNNETSTNEYCLKKIEQLYQEQQSSLASYDAGGAYRHVNIKKVDKKSNEVYEEGLDFEETTNTAEMMSMAQVYFEFELDDAKQSDVENYLTGLYYGSHTTEIKETDHYTKDEDGNKILEYTDADITLTTYYFDDIFDCALGSSNMYGGESAIAGKEFTIPQTFKQSITYEGTMDWAFRVAKSASNPMRRIAEAWRQNGSKSGTAADGMENTPCIEVGGQKRYLCALVSHYAQIGDYVDAYLEDGTILPLILIDNKGCSDGQGYHNLQTNFIYQGFHYGHTLSPGDQSVCSVLELMKVHSGGGNPSNYCSRLKPVAGSNSSSIKITKIVNGGSYLKNPSGPRYVNSTVDSTTGQTANASSFLRLMEKYTSFIKANSKYLRYGNSNNVKTYSEAKSNAADKEKSTINCVSPIMWGLKELGLLPRGNNFYSTTDGTWHGTKGSKIREKATIISSGDPIGMNVVTAAKKGLLKPGDIIANASGFNHTYVFVKYDAAENNIVVYEAGGNARDRGFDKVGCGPFSPNQYKHLKIASIIRWR